MKNLTIKIDIKSLLLGLMLGAGLILLTAARVEKSSPGRFRIASAGSDPHAVFVLDSQTSHVYRFDRDSQTDYGTIEDRKSDKFGIIPIRK